MLIQRIYHITLSTLRHRLSHLFLHSSNGPLRNLLGDRKRPACTGGCGNRVWVQSPGLVRAHRKRAGYKHALPFACITHEHSTCSPCLGDALKYFPQPPRPSTDFLAPGRHETSHPKMISKSSQNDFQIIPKWSQLGAETIPKW